jgi:hypothetical protein
VEIWVGGGGGGSSSPLEESDLRNSLIPDPKSFANEGSFFPPNSKRANTKISAISQGPRFKRASGDIFFSLNQNPIGKQYVNLRISKNRKSCHSLTNF